jgi:hypothetical protein
MSRQEEDLAYGGYYDSERGSGDGTRGFGDTFKKFRDTYKTHGSSRPSDQPQNQTSYQGQGVCSLLVPIYLPIQADRIIRAKIRTPMDTAVRTPAQTRSNTNNTSSNPSTKVISRRKIN